MHMATHTTFHFFHTHFHLYSYHLPSYIHHFFLRPRVFISRTLPSLHQTHHSPLFHVHGSLVLCCQCIPDLRSQHNGRTQLGISRNSVYPVHVLTPLQPSVFAFAQLKTCMMTVIWRCRPCLWFIFLTVELFASKTICFIDLIMLEP